MHRHWNNDVSGSEVAPPPPPFMVHSIGFTMISKILYIEGFGIMDNA